MTVASAAAPSMFAVFRRRDFSLLWLAQLVSTAGSGLTDPGAGIYVWRETESTLAVGLTTSFETDTVVEGRLYRAGEIFDADMLFNPNMIFRTGAGPGTDVQSVAAHEAGHLFGISHTAIRSSTMSYVLPKGTAARSLEADDELAYFKAYGSEAALTAAGAMVQ